MLSQATPEQVEQFHQAVELGVGVQEAKVRDQPVSDGLQKAYDQADERIFQHVRAIFGGRLREATTGAAPIAHEILEFFFAAGCAVMEGYGMTETTGVGTVNTRAQHKFGTVGRPLPGVDVRIAGDGEIEMRGPHIFQGYWRNEEATREVLDDDGWLHTGDLGEVDAEGYLRITGRKKEIIVTAGGKNVAPAVLEDRLRAHPLIGQCLVVGDGQPFIAALVTIDRDALPGWRKRHGKAVEVSDAGSAADLVDDPELRGEIAAAVEEANRAVSRAEQIRKFRILSGDFTEEGGELTPTLKVRRSVVTSRYADDIAALYSGVNQPA
jgi:long-chain acyl-CoA synthetase